MYFMDSYCGDGYHVTVRVPKEPDGDYEIVDYFCDMRWAERADIFRDITNSSTLTTVIALIEPDKVIDYFNSHGWKQNIVKTKCYHVPEINADAKYSGRQISKYAYIREQEDFWKGLMFYDEKKGERIYTVYLYLDFKNNPAKTKIRFRKGV